MHLLQTSFGNSCYNFGMPSSSIFLTQSHLQEQALESGELIRGVETPEGQLLTPASESQQQLPENVEDVNDDDLGEVPDDTMAAVLLLKSHFPKLKQKDVPPVALRSQIYSVVRDRTVVDRQLDDLRCCNSSTRKLLQGCLTSRCSCAMTVGILVQAAEQAEDVQAAVPARRICVPALDRLPGHH